MTFNALSIWNEPIKANPVLAANSQQQIDLLKSVIGGAINLDGITGAWSVPVYYADASTPQVMVKDTVNNNPAILVPIPVNFQPSPDSDGKAVIVDFAAVPRRIWSGWQWHKDLNGNWFVNGGAFSYLDSTETGDGLTNHPKGQSGGRVAGWNYYAGLILPGEITAGHIDHALLLSIPAFVASTVPIWPAGKWSDGRSTSSNALHIGSHVQLDPSLDVSKLNLTSGGKVIAKALQVYGAWIGDTGVAASLDCQEFITDTGSINPVPWANLLTSHEFYNNVLPVEKLRVLETDQSLYFSETAVAQFKGKGPFTLTVATDGTWSLQ